MCCQVLGLYARDRNRCGEQYWLWPWTEMPVKYTLAVSSILSSILAGAPLAQLTVFE